MSSWTLMAFHPLILGITVLRLWQLIRSDIWIWFHGNEFQREYNQLGLSDRTDIHARYALLDRTGARIFPFGIKSYRWRRWLGTGQSRMAKALRLPLRVLYFLWLYYIYAVVVSAYVALTTYLPDSPSGGVIGPPFALSVGCLLLVGSIALAAEAVLSYTQIKSWGVAYHGFSGDTTSLANSEISIAVGALLMSYISAIGVSYLAAAKFNAFRKIPDSSPLDLFGNSVFYGLTTMLQNGDADPQNGVGRLVVALVDINSGIFFFFVIGLVISRASAVFAETGSNPSVNPELKIDPQYNRPSEVPESVQSQAKWSQRAPVVGVLLMVMVIIAVKLRSLRAAGRESHRCAGECKQRSH